MASITSKDREEQLGLISWNPAPQESSGRQPQERARIKTLAADPVSTNSHSAAREDRILDRIQKCLDRGKHPNTPESEARSSLKMAAKLMAEHNITEAEMAFKAETTASNTQQGGESVVEVVHVKGKKIRAQAFTFTLGRALEVFFDCKFFLKRRIYSIEYNFCGIGKNTAAAAMAFEMCFNLISHWALAKKGGSERRSYCIGIAMGLYQLALEEKAALETAREGDMQLVRIDGQKVAKKYLDEHKIKIRSGRKAAAVKDGAAYNDGQADSKNINVRGKRLRCGTFKE